jgi:hypothetical protein
MQARRLLVVCALAALTACQTPAPVITLTEAAQTEPVGVAAAVSDNPSEGMTENDWGGEVPQTKPSGAVSEGGLGDLD